MMLHTIYKIFKEYGNRNALFINGKEYTYHELSEKTGQICSAIKENSHNIDDLIGIVTGDTFETYASILASWFAGRGFVPINPHNPKDRNNNIAAQSGISLLLHSEDNIELIIDKDKYQVIDTRSGFAIPFPLSVPSILPDTNLCILFTSGSTGIPKGVPMTLANIEATLDSFFHLGYDLTAEDRILQMFEFTFDMSMLSYLPAFHVGACVYHVESKGIRYLSALKIMKKHAISFAAMVPSTLSFLREYFKEIYLPNLRYSLLGGEPFYTELANEWMKCVPNATVVNISGPTETTMACMGYNVPNDKTKQKAYNGVLAFGKPWKNTIAIVVDERNAQVKTNIKGELCFSGENVMKGYWRMPEKSRDAFFTLSYKGKKHVFYKTGDIAFFDEQDDYFCCGRNDQQVKIQGHKVELGEIEECVRQCTGIETVSALAVLDDSGHAHIKLFITMCNVEDLIIRDYLHRKLPEYMIPEEIVRLNKFPVNINGKIDRTALRNIPDQ
jgi:D-alanine--poly(phosphoribitol) ligase subunit 1